jgi:hypothetical protein
MRPPNRDPLTPLRIYAVLLLLALGILTCLGLYTAIVTGSL